MRRVAIHAVVLVALLVTSYLVWTRDRAQTDLDEVVVLDGEVDAISSITFESPGLVIELVAQRDEAGVFWRGVWTRGGGDEGAGTGGDDGESGDEGSGTGTGTGTGGDDGGSGDEGTGTGTGTGGDDGDSGDEGSGTGTGTGTGTGREEASRRFVGGRAVNRLAEHLSPLMGRRALGVVAPERLEEFGLATPRGVVTITRGSAGGSVTRRLELGGDLLSRSDTYVRDADSGEVWVVDANFVRSFVQGDQRLPAIELFDAPAQEVQALVVETEGRRRRLQHHHREEPANAFWADPDASTPDELAAAWATRFLRMRARYHVQPDEDPGALTERARVTVVDAAGMADPVVLLEGRDADGEPTYYARSAYTRGLVHLNPALTTELLRDLGGVLDGR